MMIVKTVETLFIPKVVTIIKGVVFHACATQAEIGGADNSNGHSRLDTVKGHRSGETPLVAEELSKVFHGVDCFRGKHPIHGHDERDKGAAVFKTLLLTFLFLLFFGSLETFQRIGVHISFGIQVLETKMTIMMIQVIWQIFLSPKSQGGSSLPTTKSTRNFVRAK